MKAIITTLPGKSVLQEVPMPEMNEDSVLIQLKYCGVCYSEHYEWKTKGGAFGHEPMGTIVQVGKNVEGFSVGEHPSRRGGHGSVCCGQPQVKLPENVRDEDLVLEPLACIYSAVSKAHCSMPGTHVCVVGCGYMGCGAISLLKARGCYVVAVDIRESSRRDALKYGAQEAYSPQEALEKYGTESGHPGFEMVMEWGETNESLDTAIQLTRMCGQLCVGAYHTGGKRLVDVQQLNIKAIEMLSVHPRQAQLSDTGARHAAEMLASGAWCYKDIPTMIYPMNKFDQAQAELETKYGHHMKALIDMEAEDGEPHLAL